MTLHFKTTQEDFLARVTEAAYKVVLRDGLKRSFLDIELELWRRIRNVFHDEGLLHQPARGSGKCTETLNPAPALVEVA